MIDSTGAHLERFITHGLDDESREAIGGPPQGRGILGALISDARPLRLGNLAEDPRSVGFPTNHPPTGTFLGVPVMLRGLAFGNLRVDLRPAGSYGVVGSAHRSRPADRSALGVRQDRSSGRALHGRRPTTRRDVCSTRGGRGVSVLVTRTDGRIKAVIEDDGTGFDPAATDGGVGLIGMRERIELLDGSLVVETSPTSGTTVAAEVPA